MPESRDKIEGDIYRMLCESLVDMINVNQAVSNVKRRTLGEVEVRSVQK